MLTNEQKAKITEFAKSRPIELVYLFGSQARGEGKTLSDYDFAILFSNSLDSTKRFELKLEAMTFLAGLLNTDSVDVVDLNSAPPAFRYEAMAPRKVVYAKSEDTRVDFERQAMAEYFDRLYYIKRHTKDSLATIAQEGLTR